MNIILSFLLGRWQYVAIVILAGTTALFFNWWGDAKDAKHSLEIEFKMKIATAEAAAKEVEERSKYTLEIINGNHKAAITAAEKSAVAAYRRRYPNATPGRCVGGLRPVPDTPATSEASSSTAAPDAASDQLVVAGTFVTDCAKDALAVGEWQRWVRLNHLPVQGE